MLNNTIHKLERVKRAARLTEKFGGRKDGAVLTIVRSRPNVLKVSDSDTDVRVVAMTEAIDVDDEVVIASGVRPDSYFFRNRSVFLDHTYDIDSHIGNARRFVPRPTKGSPSMWEVHVKLIKDHRHTPKIMDLCRSGDIGTSIGFARLEGGKPTEEELARYTKDGRKPLVVSRSWEWIELSFTAIPANVEAQAIGTDEMEEAKASRLDELVSKGRCPRDLAVALGLPESPKRRLYPTSERPRLTLVVGVDPAKGAV